MLDHNGREIDYLRISVTDRCNLRCRYCMPEGIKCLPMPEILTYEEICTIAETAAELGIRHIKLTGGEPLVRRGVISLVEKLKAVPGIEAVTMTTNGILLEKELPALIDAGDDFGNVGLGAGRGAQGSGLAAAEVFREVFFAERNTGEHPVQRYADTGPVRLSENAYSEFIAKSIHNLLDWG